MRRNETIDRGLTREAELICFDFQQPANRNIGFVGKRVLDLVAAGYRLADIETALRACDAPIFLVGLPWVAEQNVGYRLFLPGNGLDDAGLRYKVWIGINGRQEVDRVLAEESISPANNLINLGGTGFITTDDEPAAALPDPTRSQLLKWLLLDAPTWTARRDAILQHWRLLSTEEARGELASLAEHQELDTSSRKFIGALSELVSHISQGGPSLAFQNCRFLVLEALMAFLGAKSWPEAASSYAVYENELSGDLAGEILTEIRNENNYTAAQRAVIEAHAQVLESAWECGIEAAIAEAELRFPAKAGTPAGEDYLLLYLRATNLEAACEALQSAPAELLQLDHVAVMAGMQQAGVDDLWRVGFFEDFRDRGADDSYRDWSEIRSIEYLDDSKEAIRRLGEILDRSARCLRDRALELLLEVHARTDDKRAQLVVAQELANSRSDASPPNRRPLDLVNLGAVSSQLDDLTTARAAFREARQLFDRLRDRPARARFWLKVGIFSRDFDGDMPMALHSFRAAANECAGDDLVSFAYAFEQLSSMYRSLGRFGLAEVYSALAERAIVDLDDSQHGVAGSCAAVTYAVQKGLALTEYLLGQCEEAFERVQWLLTDSPQIEEERVELERIALACALENGRWRPARKIVKSWSGAGRHDWALLGSAAITLGKSAQVDPDRSIDLAETDGFHGLAETLGRLGASASSVKNFFRPAKTGDLERAMLDMVAGVTRPDAKLPVRLFGDHEAAAWATHPERRAAPRMAANGADRLTPLRSGAPWSQIIAHYEQLSVWELPDLAVLGSILDRWSLLSRFEGRVRINPIPPCEGSLNFYFYRSDPEAHFGVRGCAYLPEGDLIICSLDYLDDLFKVGRVSWDAEKEKIRIALIEGNWPDADNLAISAVNKIRAREGILLEWAIAHEIGHAHFGHSVAATAERALALEDQADSFFIEGTDPNDGLHEALMSVFGQLNLLYEYDCENQFHRALTPQEVSERSLRLDAAPDASGHRPLVFRAVSLVRAILRVRPSIEDESYIEQFAASLEGR